MSQPPRKKSRLPRSPHNPETKVAAMEYRAHHRKVSGTSKASTSTTVEETANLGDKRKANNRTKYKRRKKDFKRSVAKSIEYAKQLNDIGLSVLTPEEISLYETTSDHNIRAEIIKIMAKYIIAGEGQDRVWIFDVDDFARRRGGAEKNWLNKTITKEQLKAANFQFLRFGTSYGYKVVDGVKELVFAARFTPYASMSNEEVYKVQRLSKHFHNTFRYFNWIKNNGAHRKGGGEGDLAAEGWTAGYEKEFHLYRVKKAHSQNRSGLTARALKQRKADVAKHTGEDEMKFVSGYYEGAFERLCPAARDMNLHWMDENRMPKFGEKTWDPKRSTEAVSASNLTVTRNNFSNVVHCDNDASPFAFGIWFLSTDEGDIITDDKTSANAVDGGQFFLPEFKIAVEFAACTGTVEMMWRGQYDAHATTRSTSQPGVTRIGTSIQGARGLLQKVRKTGDARLERQEAAIQRVGKEK